MPTDDTKTTYRIEYLRRGEWLTWCSGITSPRTAKIAARGLAGRTTAKIEAFRVQEAQDA